MGATFRGEVQEDNNEEDLKEWSGDSGASSYITYKKKDMTYVKKCEINVTLGNGQRMKCEMKGSVNMKLQDGKTVKFPRFLYLPQAVKNFFERIKDRFNGHCYGGLSG